MPRIYKERDDGNIYEIQNWDMRKSNSRDAFIVRLLNKDEKGRYAKLKSAGKRDTEIWMALHPEWPRAETKAPVPHQPIAIPIEDLTKEQLVKLITQSLHAEVPTMKRMSMPDLRVLLSRLLNSGTVRVL